MEILIFTVQAQTGFIIWSKGGEYDRELYLNKLDNGKVGEEKLAVNKADGADIHFQISYDGGIFGSWKNNNG